MPPVRKMRRVAVEQQQQRHPNYLQPYTRAVKRHGAEFGSLLWASPKTQRQRFEAIVELVDPTGLIVLDLGCGRADLLDFFIARDIAPLRYIGIEAIAELADAAARKAHPGVRIIRDDFVENPRRIESAGADVILCSGSLNTLAPDAFYSVLRQAFAAARRAVVFNFLCSPMLAAASFLHWHHRHDVERFARSLTNELTARDSYIVGDCTLALWKARAER
jgi:SAM-dependent methyltransferase